MENIVFLLTVLPSTGVLMLFSCVVLESSALLSSPSVVSMDCPICCCSLWCALSELSGSAVHVATSLLTLCTIRFTVTAPILLEVSINASLLLASSLVFLCFCLLLTSSLPSHLLRFGGVHDRGVDPFAGVLAMVEMIPFNDVVVLCFCWDVCFLCGCPGMFVFWHMIVVSWNSMWHVINMVA